MSCNNNKVFLNFTLFSVQAFSKAEVTAAKQLKEQLESFQERTDAAWKEMRWIEDAVQKGRNQATVSSASSLLPVKVLRDVTRINLPGGLRGSKFYPSPLSLSLSLSPSRLLIFPPPLLMPTVIPQVHHQNQIPAILECFLPTQQDLSVAPVSE